MAMASDLLAAREELGRQREAIAALIAIVHGQAATNRTLITLAGTLLSQDDA